MLIKYPRPNTCVYHGTRWGVGVCGNGWNRLVDGLCTDGVHGVWVHRLQNFIRIWAQIPSAYVHALCLLIRTNALHTLSLIRVLQF